MRLVLAAAVCALVPASAFAVDYLTAEQAAKLMFPDAENFDIREIRLDAAQMQQLDVQGVRARSVRWSVRVAQRGGTALGFVVVDEVIGKFELITYAVGIGLDGAVKQVEVASVARSAPAKAMDTKSACRRGASSSWARPTLLPYASGKI